MDDFRPSGAGRHRWIRTLLRTDIPIYRETSSLRISARRVGSTPDLGAMRPQGTETGDREHIMNGKVARLPTHDHSSSASPRLSASETRLTQVAYEKILKAIVYGRLDLGEPLSENDLAKALNVSKAPIRQSLNELRLKGLVEIGRAHV